MVVEDETGIVGYALAAFNIKTYNQRLAVSLIPELRLKYPLDDKINELPSEVQVFDKIPNIELFFYSIHFYSYRMLSSIFIRLYPMYRNNCARNIHPNFCVQYYLV